MGDAGEAHGDAGFVAGRAGDAVEGDLQDQLRLHDAHRAEAVDGVVSDPAVELAQFLVGESEIGLAHPPKPPGPPLCSAPPAARVTGIAGIALALARPGGTQDTENEEVG